MDPVRQTADMTDAPVLLDVSDSVATITLNRPEAMNSLDVATKEALVDIVGRVAADPEVRCVVLTGSGRAFCVGQDLKEHIAILRSDSSEQLFRTVDEHYNPLVHTLATMPKPVVARLMSSKASQSILADTWDLNDPSWKERYVHRVLKEVIR